MGNRVSDLFPGLTDQEAKALVDTATAIGTQPEWLWELVNFESRHDPAARNPKSGARGLVQFMPATAKAMGFKDADDLVANYPDYESQMLGPVLNYFLSFPPVMKPYTTRQALYMKVFFPLAARVPADTTFESLYLKNPKSTGGAEGYKKFVAQNPGIKTVADYVNKTLQLAKSKWTQSSIVRAAAIGGGGVAGGLLALGGIIALLRSGRV